VTAERYEASGGDIRNAVLKAPRLPPLNPAPIGSRSFQRHFEGDARSFAANESWAITSEKTSSPTELVENSGAGSQISALTLPVVI
jgi:hypothetical protein